MSFENLERSMLWFYSNLVFTNAENPTENDRVQIFIIFSRNDPVLNDLVHKSTNPIFLMPVNFSRIRIQPRIFDESLFLPTFVDPYIHNPGREKTFHLVGFLAAEFWFEINCGEQAVKSGTDRAEFGVVTPDTNMCVKLDVDFLLWPKWIFPIFV